jgi:hypothetical protein
MKVGTQTLVYKVENILYENHVKNGRRRIANEIVDEIMSLIGGEVNTEWNIGHGFPQDLEAVVRKFERGLGLTMPRDTDAAETYRWIKEQEQNGRPIKKFIEWAISVERAQYVGKYRKSPGLLKIDYEFAFETQGYNPQGLEIGF